MRPAIQWLSVLLFAALLLGGGYAVADESEGSILFVAPHRLILTPDEKADVITVSNKSTEKRRYEVEFIDQVMDEHGVTQRRDGYPYSIQKMVQFLPHRFDLEPGDSQNVRVVVKRPPGLGDGDYHSHLLFREIPLGIKDKPAQAPSENKKSVSFEIRTLYGIAVPVIVQQGHLVSDISMGDPVLGTAPDKAREVTLTFNRTGNAEAAAKLSIDYVAPGKKPVAAIEPQWVRIYREVDKVTKSLELVGLPKGASGGKLVLTFAKDDKKAVPATKEIPFN